MHCCFNMHYRSHITKCKPTRLYSPASQCVYISVNDAQPHAAYAHGHVLGQMPQPRRNIGVRCALKAGQVQRILRVDGNS
jgi:hypothetical protein